MADNQAVDDAVTEASHESEQDTDEYYTTEDEDNITDLVPITSRPSTSRARASPNPTPTTNNDSSIVQALTPPADLELQRSYGKYDYTVCNVQDPSTSSSSFAGFSLSPYY